MFKAGGDESGRAGMMGPGGMRRTLSLNRDETGENWPLIRFLLDDPVYYEKYMNYIEELVNGAFNPDDLAGKCRQLEELLEPYAIQQSNQKEFASAVQELIDRIYQCHQAAAGFVAAGS